jgi:hypothetical protein
MAAPGKVPQNWRNKFDAACLYGRIESHRLQFVKSAGIMNKPLIFLLVAALVLAQGLRLCVHAPDASHGGIAQPSLVHYEADTGTDTGEAGIDFDMTYVLQVLDFHNLLAGVSAFALLLFSLLLLAGQGRQSPVVLHAGLRPSDGFRLRPPLRAPPL